VPKYCDPIDHCQQNGLLRKRINILNIHYQTLGLVIGVVGIMTTIIMIMVWRINPSEKGPGCWALAACLTVISFFVLWLRPLIGSYTTFINNSLALTGTIVILEGILRFKNIGNPNNRKKWSVLIVLFFVVMSLLNRDNPARRYLMHDAIQVVLAILSAYFLISRTKGLDRIVQGGELKSEQLNWKRHYLKLKL